MDISLQRPILKRTLLNSWKKRDKRCGTGSRMPQALRAIREMKSGDRVFIYHSMGDPSVVGVADVIGSGRAGPGKCEARGG